VRASFKASVRCHASGGHAGYTLAFVDATMLLPEAISYEQAAPIFCASYTVWSGLRLADPMPGERIAVVGIGGLGHLAVQYAKAAGFETPAVSARIADGPADAACLGAPVQFARTRRADRRQTAGAAAKAHRGAGV
jgi:D-arabinose 1-dehydrogenase-like Zn-dependent alcohol dehydrogenase